MRLKTQNLDDI